jgi:hypothetical protein
MSPREKPTWLRGTEQELAQCHEIGVGLFAKPTAPHDELFVETVNMGDGTAEAAYPEFGENAQNLQRRPHAATLSARPIARRSSWVLPFR